MAYQKTERRLGFRKKKKVKGEIFDASGFVSSVTTIDISSSGARIEYFWGTPIPPRFKIVIGSDIFDAELVWRDGFEAGIHFIPENDKFIRNANDTPTTKRLHLSDIKRIVNLSRKARI